MPPLGNQFAGVFWRFGETFELNCFRREREVQHFDEDAEAVEKFKLRILRILRMLRILRRMKMMRRRTMKWVVLRTIMRKMRRIIIIK